MQKSILFFMGNLCNLNFLYHSDDTLSEGFTGTKEKYHITRTNATDVTYIKHVTETNLRSRVPSYT